MENLFRTLKKIIPQPVFKALQPGYHYALAFIGAVLYRFPAKNITVIAVTGTKGKSTVTELITQILQADGRKVASLSTIQFSIAGVEQRNLFKMTMPGRFFVQKFLRQAVDAHCSHAVIEMTSEGAKQYRHAFIDLDALVFTNLTPEHIESHGSFEKYKAAKLRLAAAVMASDKRPRVLISNSDDEYGKEFLQFEVEEKIPYSLKDLTLYSLHKDGISLVYEDKTIRIPLVGLFNVYNCLAALKTSEFFGVSLDTASKALTNLKTIKGRVEHFETAKDAPKKVIAVVDYAHTTDSLEKFYTAFPDKNKICILGNTGGGRDTWKRPEMAAIAEKHCSHIILTNEDPYDENPKKIIDDMLAGIEDKEKVQVIMDRRKAIETAINKAEDGTYVLVSGKGTDPYIMGPNGTRAPWSDAEEVRRALRQISAE